jgi:hypothetical protein
MERFQRITPKEDDTAVDMAAQPVNGPEIEAPEAQEAVPPPQAPQFQQARAPVSQMPETITIPMQQFVQLQQQLQHAKELKPLPEESQTNALSAACVKGYPGIMPPGHQIETRVIHQTQALPNGHFVEITQTLILCVKCGASLAQIRGSLGM